jgi:hypothetical protein
LVGGLIYGILAMRIMLLTIPAMPKGVWVHLLKLGQSPTMSDAWIGALIVRVKYAGLNQAPELSVNSKTVGWEDLDYTLKEELGRRREWVVYVGGDDKVSWHDVTNVINVAHEYHAGVVLITGNATSPP